MSSFLIYAVQHVSIRNIPHIINTIHQIIQPLRQIFKGFSQIRTIFLHLTTNFYFICTVMEFTKDQKEFSSRFSNEEECIRYLIDVRWPDGYCCNICKSSEYWILSRKRLKCKKCGSIITLTASTAFEQSNKHLVLWFKAIRLILTSEESISVSEFQKVLGFGSYKTALIWYHKIMALIVPLLVERLNGEKEACELFFPQKKEEWNKHSSDYYIRISNNYDSIFRQVVKHALNHKQKQISRPHH